MKIIRRLISAGALLVASAAAAAAQGGPQAVWLEQVHNFGAFDEEMGVVTCRFGAVNTGTEPLIILNATANCGCTRPEFDSAPVAPGDTAWVTVGYNPSGRPGKFEKYIAVTTNASEKRMKLEITGTVIGTSNTLRGRFPVDTPPAKLRSTVIPFGEQFKGKTFGAYLEGYNASHDTIHPSIANLPRHLAVVVDPVAVAPGEQFIISAVAHSDQTPRWGVVTDKFSFIPDRGADPIDIETVMILREDFSKLTPKQLENKPNIKLSTHKINLDRIKATDTKPLTCKFTISNEGIDPLVIHDIYTPDKAVSVDFRQPLKIKKGKSATVTVTVDPTKIGNTELLNARLTITCNDSDQPSPSVRVVAEVVR